MYCLVLVKWIWLGEEGGKGGSGYEAGTYFMALDVREKYQSNYIRTFGDFCSI